MAALTAYVRKTGSDTNGGSSVSTTPDKQGTDGVTNGTTTFTSAAGLFVAGDVDKLIMIGTKNRFRITGYTNATTITISGTPSGGSGLTWKIGGAVTTVGALLTSIAAAALAGGDIIWIGPGTYREIVGSVVLNSPTSELQINGDVAGVNTGDAAGPVILTSYLTDYKTAPSASQLFATSTQKDNLTFQNIVFIGGTGQVMGFNAGVNITFKDCAFINAGAGTAVLTAGSTTFGVAANWLFDRCFFWKGASTSYGLQVTLTTGVGADYDANIVVQNCVFSGQASTSVNVLASGTAANRGGGVIVRNCYASVGTILSTAATYISTSIPCEVVNTIGPQVSAGTSGQIVENYNVLTNPTPRVNVTAGANSFSDSSKAVMLHFGQEQIWNGLIRQFAEPMADAGILGFGNDGSQTATDARGAGHPRPAGGTSALPAVGTYERSNTFVKNTTTVHTGSNSISATGPAYQEFLIPVDAVSTSVSVYVRWDGTYAGTKPQLQIDANASIGVSQETKTAVGSSGAWEKLTLTSFTPTAKGVVRIRVISNDTNGAGQTFVDDFNIL